jgi:hypothetical protein
VNEQTIADTGEREAIWLIHPAPHGAWIAVHFGGERLEV